MLHKYRIFETEEFQKKFKKIVSQDAKMITQKLQDYVYPQLKQEPFYGRNIKKLKAYNPGIWRYRIGNYRLFYIIGDDNVVYILTIDSRKDAYK